MPVTIEESQARVLGGVRVERAAVELPSNIPLCAKSVQLFRCSAGQSNWSKSHLFTASWLLSGHARVALGARRWPMGEGEVAISLPAEGHRYWTLDAENEVCQISVDGPMAESLAIHLGLRGGVHLANRPAPLPLIRRLMEAMKNPTIPGIRKASRLTIAVMYHLADSLESPEIDPGVRRAQQIIQDNFSDPELSADSIAVELNYHRGSLSRLFHKTTGVTIIDYLARIRLERAKALLIQRENKVVWIAEQCGFREATYFCRWLKKLTGQTSRELRCNGNGKEEETERQSDEET